MTPKTCFFLIEKEFLDSLPLSQQCTEEEEELLHFLFENKLKKVGEAYLIFVCFAVKLINPSSHLFPFLWNTYFLHYIETFNMTHVLSFLDAV